MITKHKKAAKQAKVETAAPAESKPPAMKHINLALSDDLLHKVNEYRFAAKIGNRAAAFRRLIGIGLKTAE